MKISKRQLRKIIKEAWQAEREHYYSTDKPRGAVTFAADFINPDQESVRWMYLDLAKDLGLQVTTNTPKMLTVQGSQEALIEFGRHVEDVEGGPNIRGGAGFDEQGLINSMRPVIETTRRQPRRAIREEVEQLDYELSKGMTDMMLDKEHPEDVEAQEDSWAGGQNIHWQVDHSEAGGGDPQGRGAEVLKITESQLRYAIRHVIVESEQQKLLGLGHEYSAMDLLQKAKELVGSIGGIHDMPEGDALATAIRNKITKDQIKRGSQLWGDFNMILGILDPERGRKQRYRMGIEDEMRQLDPTGIKQKTGRVVRAGNQAVERDY